MISLGISFSGKCIRFVGVDSSGDAVYIKEAEADVDFSEDLSYYSRSASIIGSTGEIIRETIAEQNAPPGAVSFSIDTNNAFLNVIPVDFSETEPNLKSRILWDLSNYFPDSYKNYRLNFFKLGEKKYSREIYNVLFIAVHNNLNQFFGKIFAEAEVRVKVFDIDQLAAATGVYALNKELAGRNILIGCRRSRIDISVIENNKVTAYTYLLYKDVDFERSLRKELLDLNLNSDMTGSNIFVYGEEISEFALGIAKDVIEGTKVSFVDIYNRAGKGLNTEYKEFSYKFAPAYGLSLKGLQG